MSDVSISFEVANNDLARDDGLRTAVVLSLFTDRQAEAGDVLPAGQDDRRGWWGDSFPVVDGDKIGSRLWLLSREKIIATVATRAEEYALEALAWLIEDKVASSVEATARLDGRSSLKLAITIHRPGLSPVQYEFSKDWSAEVP